MSTYAGSDILMNCLMMRRRLMTGKVTNKIGLLRTDAHTAPGSDRPDHLEREQENSAHDLQHCFNRKGSDPEGQQQQPYQGEQYQYQQRYGPATNK